MNGDRGEMVSEMDQYDQLIVILWSKLPSFSIHRQQRIQGEIF